MLIAAAAGDILRSEVVVVRSGLVYVYEGCFCLDLNWWEVSLLEEKFVG